MSYLTQFHGTFTQQLCTKKQKRFFVRLFATDIVCVVKTTPFHVDLRKQLKTLYYSVVGNATL